ncbi:MAG: type IX secretion system protein PorQ [Prevotellaceae bacterium]|jgi:hypothetical protein|nr:type IX secretion system protein PorQ [Prevotellaceae bacterium]
MRKFYTLFSLLILFSVNGFSQAGRSVYAFLDLPVSSRIGALGGTNVSLRDGDLNFAFKNPALLSPQTHNMIALNVTNYLADIAFGTAAYGRSFGEKNFAGVGIQYIDYGKFLAKTETNENPDGGDTEVYFTAQDLAFYIMYARPLSEHLTIGTTLKPIYSAYERYTSFGLAVDVGLNYSNENEQFSAGLVFRNIGRQLKGYYSDKDGEHLEALPFDIQLGLSQKLKHAPLRFSLTLNNLHIWDLSYNSTNKKNDTNIDGSENTDGKIGFFDMALRHAIIGVEFLPGKNFYLAAAYNHRRHQELIMPGFKSLSGFSFGAGIKLAKFHVGFAMTQFQAGAYSYNFSISTSLTEFGL